ncbi:MAG: LysR family transcriptional regulator [Sphingomonadaceae bacterium]|nr:LysR family transcriptional regulator [Sphingomonadaceae bacterium]
MSDSVAFVFDLQSVSQALLLAEHLSIRLTAEQLGLRPSAVSRRVRALEEQLNVTLFERHSAGVRTTLAGRRFLERARWAMAELDHAGRDATNVQRGEAGVLGVAFYPSLASGRLHHLIGSYHTRFPALELSFLEDASMDQLVALRQRRVDVAFLIAVDEAPGAESEHLWDERIYVALPEAHAFATRETLKWEELRQEAFVVRAFGSGPVNYAWLAGKLHPGGYAPKIRQHAVCRESLLSLVGGGFALTIVSEAAIAVKLPGVVYRPVVDEGADVSVRMAWLTDNENPALGRFLSHARRAARHGAC